MSSPAGSFFLLGSAPATASLVATGAQPSRHVKMMLEFPVPAGFTVSGIKGGRPAAMAAAGVQHPRYILITGGRRAVVVAAGAVVPGGSDDYPLYCEAASNIPSSSPAGRFGVDGALAGVKLPHTLIAAGAPHRPMKVLPAGFLASNSKGRRLAVVVAAGATSTGESDEGPSEDCEAAVSEFRLEMELFKISQRPVALAVGSPSDLLIDGGFGTAKDCREVLEFLLAKVPIHRDSLKELITVGQSFLTVESQAKEGYVKADALANSIQGLKLVGNTFFEGVVDLPDYSAPMVPLSAEDVDKESFFKELINVFIVLYTALYWEACKKYGYTVGANN